MHFYIKLQVHEYMWKIFRFAKLKSRFVKHCNAFELLLGTVSKYLMQHVWNLFLVSSVSVTLEEKFVVAGCDFRKMVALCATRRFTKHNLYVQKKPRASSVLFSLHFLSITVSCSKLQKRFYFGKVPERQDNFQSHTLTKFLIFREISYSVTAKCLGIVLIKFKRIPGCFHLFIIQQHMWNVPPLSHLIRCFGVLVSFISVCLLPFPATSALTLGWSRRWWSGLVLWQANTQWVGQHQEAQGSSEVHKCVDFAEQGG